MTNYCPDCGTHIRADKCQTCLWSQDRSDIRSSHEYESSKCLANGCPLPGTISTKTYGNGEKRYMCAEHFKVKDERHRWPAITVQIKANLSQQERTK